MNRNATTRRLGIAGIAAGAATALALGGLGAATPAGATPRTSASVSDDTLTVLGSSASESLALRLAAGDPNTLQVDFGDDGSAEFTIDRSGVAKITLDRVATDLQAGTIGLFVDGVAVR